MTKHIKKSLAQIPQSDRRAWINQLKSNRDNETQAEVKREISETIAAVSLHWNMA